MAVAAAANASAVNLDSFVNSLVIPFASTGTTQGIAVFVGVHSKFANVLSVIDDVGNVYTKQKGAFTNFEEDYVVNQYDTPPKGSITHHGIDGEVWTTRATTGSVTKVTVTLNTPTGARFAVEIQGYTGCSAIGASAVASFASTSAPSISLVTTAASSVVCAGFASNSGLNQAATAGTLRGQIEGGTVVADGVVEVAVADLLVASSGATGVVTLAPTNTEVLSGSTTLTTIAVPMTYVVCAVEIKA